MKQKQLLSSTQILRRAADDLRSGVPVQITNIFQDNTASRQQQSCLLYPAEFIHPDIENVIVDSFFGKATLYIRSNNQIFSKDFSSLAESKAEIHSLIELFVKNQGLDKLQPVIGDRMAESVTSFLGYAQLLPAALVFHSEEISEMPFISLSLQSLTFDSILDGIELIPGSTIILPTLFGEFTIIPFRATTGEEHLAIVNDPLDFSKPILIRVHSSCFTGDILTSLKCDCGPQIQTALLQIVESGSGVVLYLSQEGRGIGLLNKMRAYHLQMRGLDTVDANTYLGFQDDQRHFGVAKKMLTHLGIDTVNLLTNNPRKVDLLQKHGIRIVERVPIKVPSNEHNVHYLNTKRIRSSHYL